MIYNFINKKKVRGIKRKLNSFKIRMKELTEEFPIYDLNENYWHLHMPIKVELMDSIKTPNSIKNEFIRITLNRTVHFINIKPNKSFSKVVACINLTNLSNSQIIIFFNEDYYRTFFNRNDEDQKWIEIEDYKKLNNFTAMELAKNLSIKGYKEIINYDDFNHIGELWFIGELN